MQTILAIDWGSKHIGTAIGNDIAKIASPYKRLQNTEGVIDELGGILSKEGISRVVVGLPRNLQGAETEQSKEIRRFARHLEDKLQCRVLLQDETLSTLAGQELQTRFPKADKDTLAASVILQDYLNSSL